jgi:hypothetical protein
LATSPVVLQSRGEHDAIAPTAGPRGGLGRGAGVAQHLWVADDLDKHLLGPPPSELGNWRGRSPSSGYAPAILEHFEPGPARGRPR